MLTTVGTKIKIKLCCIISVGGLGRCYMMELIITLWNLVTLNVFENVFKFRQLFKRSDVDTVQQFRALIVKFASINECVVYRDGNGREPNFKWYGWDYFFSEFCKPLKGIRKFHHFRFTKEDPGHVYVKEHVQDQTETRICLLKRGVSWPPQQLEEQPEEIPAGGQN